MRLALLLVLTGLAIGLCSSSGAGVADGPTLVATVDPAQISVTLGGAPVSHLDPGPYTIQVDDRSATEDFMLSGPGVHRDTDYEFVGQQTWQVTLEDGYFEYYSSPHEGALNGALTVGTPPPDAVTLSVAGGAAPEVQPAQLQPGRHSVAVDDRSTTLNVRLAGPGVDEHTQNHIARPRHWTVSLADGVYHVFSDRQPDRGKTITVGSPPPASGDRTLTAITGPDFSITLLHADSSPVTRLDPGRYTIVVEDTSAVHDYHLTGPGVDRTTSLAFVGRETWEVDLANGAYSYFCDPHTQTMTGGFRVGPASEPRRRLSLSVAANGGLRGPSSSLAAGSYDVTASDRSKRHNLHLTGPGVNRKTGRAFRGTARWRITLAAGSYRYRSDASPKRKRGFRVQ